MIERERRPNQEIIFREGPKEKIIFKNFIEEKEFKNNFNEIKLDKMLDDRIDRRGRLERRNQWNDNEIIGFREDLRNLEPFRIEQPPKLPGLDRLHNEIAKPRRNEAIQAWLDHIDKEDAIDDKKIKIDPLVFFRPAALKEFNRGIQLEARVEGTLSALALFLAKEPQRSGDKHFRYLLTSGLAVEAITGASRFHHDTDLVILDTSTDWFTKYLTDNVTSQKYWADMNYDPSYLEETAWVAKFKLGEEEHEVITVHPAIIMVQKLSNAWGRPPRDRDRADVQSLMIFWSEILSSDPSWLPIIEKAVQALPKDEQARTRERLAPYLPHILPTKELTN